MPRINVNERDVVVLKSVDIVMVRTAIQSDPSKNKVVKLYYAVRGSYQITHITGRGSCFIRKFNKPDSPGFGFMAYDLNLLPSSQTLSIFKRNSCLYCQFIFKIIIY